MKLLLDTHVLLWFLAADRRLGQHARGLIEDTSNTVLISIISLWEIALKSRLGKLRIDLTQLLAAVGRADFELLGLKESHLRALATLPVVAEHRDPFDHLLIAQAVSEDLTFLSGDAWVRNYSVRFETCSTPRPA